MEPKVILFLDSIQRTVIATLVSKSPGTLTVTKPAVLSVAPSTDKKVQVQLYPLLFREFHKDRDVFPEWSYSLTSVTLTDNLELEPGLVSQYNELFKVVKATPAPTIKLFDAK